MLVQEKNCDGYQNFLWMIQKKNQNKLPSIQLFYFIVLFQIRENYTLTRFR